MKRETTASDFAKAMIRYGELAEEMAQLEELIAEYVMEVGKTQVVGNVRATYSNGRTTYDYEAMAMSAEPSDDIIAAHSKTTTDWRELCQYMEHFGEVPSIIKSQTDPSVKVKVEA